MTLEAPHAGMIPGPHKASQHWPILYILVIRLGSTKKCF